GMDCVRGQLPEVRQASPLADWTGRHRCPVFHGWLSRVSCCLHRWHTDCFSCDWSANLLPSAVYFSLLLAPGSSLTMLLDFEVQRCTRRCAATDRALAPGDECYSVLEVDGAKVIRKDYCSEAWKGPAEAAFGWWKSCVPEPT